MLGNVKVETSPPAHALTILLLALPWLNPVTFGPTHPVVQGLTVWAGAAFCCMVWALDRTGRAAQLQSIASAWLLAALLSAAMGLLQYLGLAELFSPFINYVEAGQAYANLRQRNQQATLLAIGLCALLWWQAQGAVRGAAQLPGASPRRRVVALAGLALAAALLATADAASGSRTGLLQLLVLLALGLLWRRGRATVLWVLLAYALAAFVLPRLAGLDPLHSGILGRLGEAPSVCASRLTLWSNVLHLIAQKPWTGWGWGELGYAHLMTLYPGERFCEILGNAHNLPLHLAVELGVPVAVLMCAAVLGLVLRAKPWREPDATRQMAWSVLAVIAVHSLLEYPLWYGPFQLAALLALCLLWSTRSPQTRVATGVAPDRPLRAAVAVAAATAVLAACGYAAWDYWRISQIYLAEAQRAPSYREATLEKIRASWLFANQVQFAELGITPLSADNAEHIHALALRMLHFSPEASVLIKVMESAKLLGLQTQAYQTRFEVAYPADYAAWRRTASPATP
jgi:O-antigen ligase